MQRLVSTLLVLGLSATGVLVADEPTVHTRDGRGIPTFVTGDLGHLGADLVGDAKVVVRSQADLFRSRGTEELRELGTTTDALGRTHVRLQQTIDGLPVVGGELIVHGDAAGRVYAITGRVATPEPGLVTRQRVDVADALTLGGRAAGLDAWEPASRPDTVYYLGADGEPRLTYSILASYVDGRGDSQLDRLFVDVTTGELVAKDALHKYARNRRTYDANNGTSLPGSLARNESSGSSGDAALDAAHEFAGATYDYYAAVHGRDSYDDNGATLHSTVHYSSNYNNAFWNGSQMVYGDGDGTTFAPLSLALDVDAHELTHAVTERTANLIYEKESGALNEAMSDIFGAAVEAWYDGAVSADTWRLGEAIYTPNGSSTDALRYMDNPTADGYSPDYYPERLYPGSCNPNPNTNDNCGVHGNSGIANLAFVLLVDGGTHPRGKTTVNVPAIGMAKAERIFYRALTTYMTSTTNFEGARSATAQAADDLYGQAEVDAVHDAWDAVGVPGSGGGGGGGGTELENGVAVSNLSGSTGSEQRWTMDVPSGASDLVFQISGGSGDADLYVRFATAPTTSSYDCRPYLNGNNETCTFASPSTGTYHVMIRAYSTYSGVNLVGSYSTSTPNEAPTASFSVATSDLTANFTDTSSDSDGSIASRSWTFGDGGSSGATNPSHNYAAAGTYTVTLTVTDDDGATDSATQSVTVTAPPTGGCNGDHYSGTLSNGGSEYQPNGTYYYAGSGTHSGVLDGPAGTDFDLYLNKWSGGRWRTVKSGTTGSSHEEVTYNGSAGYYTWRVRSYSGSGSYDLCLNTP